MLVTFPPPISTLFRKSTPRKACTCDGLPRDVGSDRQLFGPSQPSHPHSHSYTHTLRDRGRHRVTETETQVEAGRHTLGVGHTLALPLPLSHGQRQSFSCTASGWLRGTGTSQQSKNSSDQYRASVIRWHSQCDRFSSVHTVSVSLPLPVCDRPRPRRALGNFPARFSTDGGESLGTRDGRTRLATLATNGCAEGQWMLVRCMRRTWERRDTTTDVGVGNAVRFTPRSPSHDLFVRGSDVDSTTRHDGSGSECFLLVLFLRSRATRTRDARLDGTDGIRIHDDMAREHTPTWKIPPFFRFPRGARLDVPPPCRVRHASLQPCFISIIPLRLSL